MVRQWFVGSAQPSSTGPCTTCECRAGARLRVVAPQGRASGKLKHADGARARDGPRGVEQYGRVQERGRGRTVHARHQLVHARAQAARALVLLRQRLRRAGAQDSPAVNQWLRCPCGSCKVLLVHKETLVMTMTLWQAVRHDPEASVKLPCAFLGARLGGRRPGQGHQRLLQSQLVHYPLPAKLHVPQPQPACWPATHLHARKCCEIMLGVC